MGKLCGIDIATCGYTFTAGSHSLGAYVATSYILLL